MSERIAFMAIGASVSQLKARDANTDSESTKRCLLTPEVVAANPTDFENPLHLLPFDITKEAGVAPWTAIEHDSWGVKPDGTPVAYRDPYWLGAQVTTFGGMQWPADASWSGIVYLRARQFWKYRSVIERNGLWPSTKYKKCELVSIQYEADYPRANRRYLGFYGTIVEPARTGSTIARVRIRRSRDGGVAGEWHLSFGPLDEVDTQIKVGVLNEDPDVKGELPGIERPLQATDDKDTEGAIFIELSKAAQLWDRSQTQQSYGLVGPKLPFWLG